MMTFSYEWKKQPVLYDSAARLQVQSKGNAAMCLAIQQAKEELADAVGLDGEWLGMSVCVCVCVPMHYLCHANYLWNLCSDICSLLMQSAQWSDILASIVMAATDLFQCGRATSRSIQRPI